MNEIQRRARAERLGAVSEDLTALLADLEAEYIKQWRAATTPEAREDAHRYVTLIEKFRGVLNATALSGRLASEAIALEEKRKGWKIPGLRAG